MKNLSILASGAAAIAALAMSTQITGPRLVWNASASAPIGLYRIERRMPEIGEFALATPRADFADFIVERGYLPRNIPLIKRVVARSGAVICRKGDAVFIDKARVAEALQFDSQGRKLPAFEGCFLLSDAQIFLLNEPKNSLDGRYFGSTNLDDVIGVARPLWVREPAR